MCSYCTHIQVTVTTVEGWRWLVVQTGIIEHVKAKYVCRHTHTLPLPQCRLTCLWTATHYTAHITSQLPLRHLLWNGKNEAALGEDTLGMDCRTRGMVHHRMGSSWQTNIPHTQISHCYKSIRSDCMLVCEVQKIISVYPSEISLGMRRACLNINSVYTICHNTCVLLTQAQVLHVHYHHWPPTSQMNCPITKGAPPIPQIVCLPPANISMTNVTPWSCSKSLLVNCRFGQLCFAILT